MAKTNPDSLVKFGGPHADWVRLKASAAEIIVFAKAALLDKHPFFGGLTAGMRAVVDPGTPTMGVAATDTLYYNPDFVRSLSAPEAVGVMAHEVMHVALKHVLRAPKMDRTWNISADLVINAMLLHVGFKLPAGGVLPDGDDKYAFTADPAKCAAHVFPDWAGFELAQGAAGVTISNCRARHMEEVHRLFTAVCRDDPDQRGDGDGKAGEGEGKGDGDLPGRPIDSHDWRPPADEAEHAKAERAVNMRVAQAVDAAKRKGSMPGDLELMVTALLEPKVRWQDVLRNYMTAALSDEQTWARPGRSSFGLGMYMPGKARDGGVECVIHIDTSGSCFQQGPEFLSEVVGIMRDAQATGHLLMCDAAIAGEWDLESLDAAFAMPSIKGGGGTSHKPVVDWILERAPDCKLLVTLTDGCSDMPTTLPLLGRHTSVIIALPVDCVGTAPRLDHLGTVLPIESDAC
jgi:predicted metal-dependent peptidase